MATYLITSATGNVGAALLRHLNLCLAEGDVVIKATRHKDKANETPKELRYLDMEDPGSFPAAFRDVDVVFLLRPPHISKVKKYFAPMVSAMEEAGVGRVVFLSVQGAEKNRFVPHHKIEQLLLDPSMDYTFLRPSFFMQNLTTTHLGEIRDKGEIFVPAGKGKTNFIDVDDIGRIAARVLTEPGHEGKGYELTGAESLYVLRDCQHNQQDLRAFGALPFAQPVALCVPPPLARA